MAEPEEDWETTIDGWKAEIESMTEDELLASFYTVDDEATS